MIVQRKVVQRLVVILLGGCAGVKNPCSIKAEGHLASKPRDKHALDPAIREILRLKEPAVTVIYYTSLLGEQ